MCKRVFFVTVTGWFFCQPRNTRRTRKSGTVILSCLVHPSVSFPMSSSGRFIFEQYFSHWSFPRCRTTKITSRNYSISCPSCVLWLIQLRLLQVRDCLHFFFDVALSRQRSDVFGRRRPKSGDFGFDVSGAIVKLVTLWHTSRLQTGTRSN